MLPVAGSPARSTPGSQQMIDRYQVDRCIGRGGMAEVYHGMLLRMGGFARDVAVKILLPQLSGEPEFVNMLMDEARIAATINHPNVVQVLDVGQDGDTCYLVMEYVNGTDLRSLEKRHEGGRVPLTPLLFIIAEVLRGLEAIHAAKDAQGQHQKVVHRDVTPSNVLLTQSGVVKLADFGIAHATGRLTQTRHGAVKGKTRYMAPEQLDGRNIDPRTDLFAVGVLLLEALLGREAADAWQATAMGPIFKMPARIPAAVPPDVSAILQRALRERTEDRYENAAAFRKDALRALHARTKDQPVPYGADDLTLFIQHAMTLPDPGPKATQAAVHQREDAVSNDASVAAQPPRRSVPIDVTAPSASDFTPAPLQTPGQAPYQDPFPTQNLPADPPTMRVTSRPSVPIERVAAFSGPQPAGTAGPTQAMEQIRLDQGPGRLPLLSVENDAPTATAASASSQEPTVDKLGKPGDVEFSTVPGQPLPPLPGPPGLPDLPHLATTPMVAVADLGHAAASSERTLPVRSEGPARLSTLADDADAGLLPTAVTAAAQPRGSFPPGAGPPGLLDEGYTGITVPPSRRSSGLRRAITDAAHHAVTIPGQFLQSTIVRASQSTLVKAARNQLPLRLLVMVLSGLFVAGMGLLILYKVQGQHGTVASTAPPVTPHEPPRQVVPSPPEPPPRGQLQIEVPATTRVTIDNVRQQNGPHTYELPPGQHTVKLTVPRHHELTRVVELRPGSTVKLGLGDK